MKKTPVENGLIEQQGYLLPANAEIIYDESVHDWSWGTSLLIFVDGSRYFCIEDWGEIRECSFEEAYSLMEEFETMLCLD